LVKELQHRRTKEKTGHLFPIENETMNLERTQPLILVVDDEQAVLDEVAAALADTGFACRCCSTVETAAATAELLLPDLILCDVNVHGVSGVELCRRIRQDARLADVPVMFLSSRQIPDIIRRNDGAHGTYYMRKPFSPEVLVELIDRAMGASRMLVSSQP
jgi:CheY-like chemotaxis protein